jgi:hypothetical protein
MKDNVILKFGKTTKTSSRFSVLLNLRNQIYLLCLLSILKFF